MLNEWKEVYKYREFLKNSVSKDLRTRYKGSFLGFFWTFLNPLMMLVVYSVLFTIIVRMNIKDYPIYLFCTLLAWTFFQSTIQSSASVIVTSGNLLKKIYFPIEILPISVLLGGLINYLYSLIILIPALLIYGYYPNVYYLWLPLIILTQCLLMLGLSFAISALTVYFRDLEHMITIFLNALFYLTPVLFPLSMVPEKYQWLFQWNPMAVIVIAYRDIFYYGTMPNVISLLITTFLSLIVLVVAQLLFKKLKNRFVEEI
jgi:lipopolysaccharide transport system permease protein